MKRFLFPLLLLLAVFFPLTSVAAADVPNICQINPSSIKYLVSSFENDPTYIYECKDGKTDDYAMQYVELLTKNYSFKVNFKFADDGTKMWGLAYTGSKKVAPITDTENHLTIVTTEGLITLMIAKDLSYEEN